MSKYHINNDGEAGVCSATQGGCPFGGEAQHYATPEIARQAFELSLASQTVPSSLSRRINGEEKYEPVTDYVLPEQREQVFIEHELESGDWQYLEGGQMIALVDGKPKIVRLDTDPTAPYPEPRFNYGRGASVSTWEREETIADYKRFIAQNRDEIEKLQKTMNAPRFDEFDAEVSYAARERTNVLYAANSAYEKIIAGIELTASHREAAEYLLASQLRDDPEPDAKKTSDEFQRWQARTNLIAEYITAVDVRHGERNKEAMRWVLENARPLQYEYSQS